MNTSTLKYSKASPSRSKSPIKQTSTSPKKTLNCPSPNKRQKISDQAITTKMKGMRDKLCNALDAYLLILQTNAPLRCLQHNSVLSLYCQTEQRLLCANCVYRSTSHKLHKVLPIQKCYKQISRDVQQMTRQIDRQIQWADGISKSIFQLFKEQEKNTNQAILNIAQMYDQIQYQLSKAFQQSKKKLVMAMDQIFAKKQSLMLQLQFFNNIYTRNKPVNLSEIGKYPDASLQQYHLIFNHLIGNALVQFGKLQGSRVSDIGTSKIKILQKQEIAKLEEIKDRILSWNELERQRQLERQKQRIQKQKEKQKQRQKMRQKQRQKYGQKQRVLDKQRYKSSSITNLKVIN